MEGDDIATRIADDRFTAGPLRRRKTDLLTRRATDRVELIPITDEDVARQRVDRLRANWADFGRQASKPDSPAYMRTMWDVHQRQRREDLVGQLRDRDADGEIDIVQLTDEEAVALGLQKPTWRMRFAHWWSQFRDGWNGVVR